MNFPPAKIENGQKRGEKRQKRGECRNFLEHKTFAMLGSNVLKLKQVTSETNSITQTARSEDLLKT